MQGSNSEVDFLNAAKFAPHERLGHCRAMSIKVVQPEIERFLADTQAGVLVIAGKWGVGKTYAWNRYLKVAAEKGQLSNERYAYVSLFGLGNLEELKAAIFQNTIGKSDIGRSADLETLDGMVRAAPGLWRKAGTVGRLFPGADKYLSTFEKVGFFWIKNQIVCIDDLERHSKSLDARDVLGLISHLKEQRGCKVVLLLNDERMEGEDREEFEANLEKVADVTLRFEPTPAEAAAIGVDANTSFADKLRANCEALGIVNIRTIKKIERLGRRLLEELKGFDDRVFHQGLHTLTLLCFSKLQPGDAPTLDFIEGMSDFEVAFAELAGGEGLPPEHAQWQAQLSSYEFTMMDELDSVILRAVRQGHFDLDALREQAIGLQERLKASDQDQSFQQAWNTYHASFDDNADEVTAALAKAVEKTPSAISPMNLSSTIGLLKELGWHGDTRELIVGYVKARENEKKDFWDLSRSAFGGDVRDLDVREAFAAKLATFREGRDPAHVLIEIGQKRGWNPDEVRFVATLSPDDLYDIFKRLRGDELRQAIAGALMFRDISNPDEAMATVTNSSVSALQRIGRESDINRRRVMQRGVAVPEPENTEPQDHNAPA